MSGSHLLIELEYLIVVAVFIGRVEVLVRLRIALARRGGIWRREIADDVLGDRVDAIGRNHVAGEDRTRPGPIHIFAGGWIVHGDRLSGAIHQCAEVAGGEFRRGNREREGTWGVFAVPLVIKHEKRLVASVVN